MCCNGGFIGGGQFEHVRHGDKSRTFLQCFVQSPYTGKFQVYSRDADCLLCGVSPVIGGDDHELAVHRFTEIAFYRNGERVVLIGCGAFPVHVERFKRFPR